MNILKLSLIIILLFFGCSSTKHQLFSKNRQTYISPSFFQKHDYIIKPHDRLLVVIYGYPNLSTTQDKDDYGLEVAEDGKITLPIIGRIKVAGFTKNMVQRRLYNIYGTYLERKPSVKVEVLNKKIYVLGAVKNPGTLEFNKNSFITPLKAVSIRGGLAKNAKRDRILIVRGTKKRYAVAVLDLTDINSLKKYNILLQPEDIVYVADNSVSDFNLPLNGMEPSLSLINTVFSAITTYYVIKSR